jgi:hypothetical protein
MGIQKIGTVGGNPARVGDKEFTRPYSGNDVVEMIFFFC